MTSSRTQQANNLQSGPNSPVDNDTTIKKKLFARKPAFVNTDLDVKRKAAQKQSLASFKITPQPSRLSAGKQVTFTDRRYRQTQIFTKDQIYSAQFSSSNTLEFTPKADRKNTFSRSFYIQQKQPKFQTEYSSNIEIPSYSGVNKITRRSRSRFRTLDDERNDQETINNAQMQKATSIELNKCVVIKQTSMSREGSTNKKANPNKQISAQCCYCDNSKKMMDILNSKYVKLEEQYNQKNTTSKQLADKNQKLTQQIFQLRQQIQTKQSKFYSDEIQFFKSKDQLTFRIEALKKELIKSNQKLKYNEIQNAMLLRSKNEYQQLSRDHQKLKFQNQRLKRQILESAKLQQGNFRKGKSNLKAKAGKIENNGNNKTDKNGTNNEKKLWKPISIHFDCQDDNISLNLSQRSQDHY